MAQQSLNYGIAPEDHTGEGLFYLFKKTHENFNELYLRVTGSQILTVGAGGRFSSLQSAIAYVNSQPRSVTIFTGTCNLSANGLNIISTNQDSSVGLNKECYMQLNGDPFYYPCLMQSAASTTAWSMIYPIYGQALSGTAACIIVTPIYYTIHLLPGTHTFGAGEAVTIPAFTSIIGSDRNSCIVIGGGFSTDTDGFLRLNFSSTRVAFKNFTLISQNRGAAVWWNSDTANYCTTGQEVEFDNVGLVALNGSIDLIFLKGFVTSQQNMCDKLTVTNSVGFGNFDVIASFATVRNVIRDNDIRVIGQDSGSTAPSGITVGTTSGLFRASSLIANNSLDVSATPGVGVNACGIRVSAAATFTGGNDVLAIGNKIRVKGEVAVVASIATGIRCDNSVSGSTNRVRSIGNEFDVSGYTASADLGRNFLTIVANSIRSFGDTSLNSSNITTAAVGSVTDLSRSNKIQTVAYAATITPNCELGQTVIVGATTAAMTIAAPLYPLEGQRLTFILLEDATAGRVITWNSAFVFNAAFVQSVATTDANKRTQVEFIYEAISAKWRQMSPPNVWIA